MSSDGQESSGPTPNEEARPIPENVATGKEDQGKERKGDRPSESESKTFPALLVGVIVVTALVVGGVLVLGMGAVVLLCLGRLGRFPAFSAISSLIPKRAR